MEQQNNDKRIVIFDLNELNKIDFSQVETKINEIKKSVDNTKTYIEYYLPEPNCVQDLITKSQEFTQSDMESILKTHEWIDPNPIGMI